MERRIRWRRRKVNGEEDEREKKVNGEEDEREKKEG